MRWTKLARSYGLAKPYAFAVALPFLAGLLFAAVALSAFAVMGITGHVKFGSARFWFFSYLLVLSFGAALFARFPVASWLCLGLATLEVGVATATSVASKLGFISYSLLPPNEVLVERPFEYHPLLAGVPKKGFVSTNDTNVKRHNSHGWRGDEVAVTAGQILVNAYGGSTTYDTGVANGATWPEQLEGKLGTNYRVANFGVPGYSSAEHVIQTAFYSDSHGYEAKCALYYMGWNDIRNAHLPDLDAGYANFHLLSQTNNLAVRRVDDSTFSPIFRILVRRMSAAYETIPYPPIYDKLGPGTGSDPALEKIYARNIATIAAINSSRGVKTVFVGQLLNPTRLNAETSYGWLPRVRDKDVWPLQERFNKVLQAEAIRGGATYVDADVRAFGDADFVDNGHFSASGAAKFAAQVALPIREMCR